jgi:hypothetical protein
VTVVGEPATVVVDPELAYEYAEPVIVAVTVVESPAWLLGCHEVENEPVAPSVVVLGLKVVVYPAAGYEPDVAVKVNGTPC